LSIQSDLVAFIVDQDTGANAKIQLQDMDEAEKLVEEFEDPECEKMYNHDAIMEKYSELHKFRP